ncbi:MULTISPECIES: GbsR/MarR family transcriptional regulator [Thermomonosporaceae]|uniref:GbsR/MarR family transcriptional regulator n=1 Tax=Thermomonosporaceae TaxID=2012 RepID=UPI00255ADA35|nr:MULTISPECIES: MarR family transcriptional regulator [Thermomonosporaceae]MDL4770636.1 MarR family transcriptional regulator [Actinomadura xylanilytica]
MEETGPPTSSPPAEEAEAVRMYIERFAAQMADAGWQRMPARVFAALMATDSGTLTAAELAELLRVSPAAVSGAVRHLTQIHMALREREPGSRRDIFRVRDDVWQDAILGRDRALTMFEDSLGELAQVVGRESPAGRRLAESAEFFAFMQKEINGMLDRWREHRDALREEYAES